MKEKTLGEFFDNLEKDPAVALRLEYYQPLTRLVLEVEEERDNQNISQEELAKRMGTKQEAISRFESLGQLPGYNFLTRLSQALGGRLSITTNGDYAFVVPKELRPIVDKCAKEKEMPTEDLIEDLFIKTLKDLQPPVIELEEQKEFYDKPKKENLIIDNNDNKFVNSVPINDYEMNYVA